MDLVGIDEVGRGSWAGPLLVVAARAVDELPLDLKDSKLLTKKIRERLYLQISKQCAIGEGWVQPDEIDRVGLAEAMRLGVGRALKALKAPVDSQIIMDGSVNYCPDRYLHVRTVVKADQTIPIVSAASIYAKVTRDNYMTYLSQIYPLHDFDKHVGYGTRLHQMNLRKYGPTAIHRLSFKPLQEFIA